MITEIERRFFERVPNQLNDVVESLKTIAQKMTSDCVWVFTAEQAWDDETADIIVKAFPTEDAAVKYMHDFLLDDGDESIREYVERKEWVVKVDEPLLYRACKDGYYSTDHIELTITKCEIQ